MTRRRSAIAACAAAVVLTLPLVAEASAAASGSPAGAAPAATKLLVVPPADGFRRGHAGTIFVVALDAANALVDATGAPQFKGAAIEPATKVAPGVWRVEVTPAAGAARVAVDATLGAAHGALDAPVRAPVLLEISLSKVSLAPGERPPVSATIRVHDEKGAAVDNVIPTVEASAGSIGAPQKTGPGLYEAKLKLPEEHYPQAVQVVAFAKGHDEVLPARAVLVMEGRASVPLVTKPRARVTVRVGKRSWGPLPADAKGVLEAEIEASPADATMEMESVDDVGNRSSKTVALDAPPYARLWTRAEVGAPGLDAKARVTLFAFLLDRRGRPVEDAKASARIGDAVVKLDSLGGLLSGEARVLLAPGKSDLVVEAGDEKKTVAVESGAAPAVGFTLAVTPDVLVVGGAPAGVSAQLVDAVGRAADTAKVMLSAEGVALSDVQVAPGRGTAAARLAGGAIPPNAAVEARADGPGFTVVARHPLALHAGAPAKADILLTPAPMFADGTSTSTLAVRFFDAWGNTVTGLKPTAAISGGTVDVPSEVGDGTYRLTVRAPKVAGPARVTVDSGAAHTETTITYLRAPSGFAVAASAGAASNLGALTQPFVVVEARKSIGTTPYWGSVRALAATGNFHVRAFGNSYGVTMQQAVAQFGARRVFTSPLSSWGLSAGAYGAAGIAHVALTGTAAPPPEQSLVLGARLCATAERRVGNGALAFELGFGYSAAQSDVVKGNVSGADFSVGYRRGF